MRLINFLALMLVLFCLSTRETIAQDHTVRLSVNPSNVTGRIDNKVYGQFLEHIYHSVNGGIWGEVVWNRSFEETGSREWNRRFDEIASSEIWSYDKKALVSPISEKETRFNFGDGSWRDLDYSVEACRTKGNGNLVFGVHSGSFNRCYLFIIGTSDNPYHKMQRYVFDKPNFKQLITTLDSFPGEIQKDKWCKVRIRCEGTNLRVWLDGKQIFDVKDNLGQQFGQTTVGTINAEGHFRNFAVSSLKGKILYKGIPAPVRHWQAKGDGAIVLDEQNPVNDKYCLKVTAKQEGTGVQQKNFYLGKGDTCRGSVWIRGDVSRGLVVRLLDGDDIVFEKDIPALTADWKEIPLELIAKRALENGCLELLSKGSGTFWLDQFSMIPGAAVKNGGYRPDLFNAMAAIQPTIIRWPGGSFINSYIWQNGIGAQKNRKGKKGWDELDPLSLGVDEFIDLCRNLKAEPLIPLAVNIEDPNSAESIINLIEYCNGATSTQWGALRARNGHPEPYRVKYWEIGNEEWGMGADRYAEVVQTYVPLMKKIDPAMKIAVCGSGGLGLEGRGLAYNRTVIEKCADLADYISLHHYENPDNYAKGPKLFEAFWRENEKLIRKSKNPQLKLFISEWNAQSVDWRSGLYCGGLLNEFEKASELVEMATPALWLRHISAPQWDNAFINFNHRTWFAGANYLVMKLWRNHFASERIQITGKSDSLNVVATRSADVKKLFIKIVNPSSQSVPVEFTILEGLHAGSAEMQLIAPGTIHAINTIDDPNVLKVNSISVQEKDGIFRTIMPSHSVGVVTISSKL
jgi:alpha-N-arabinofuranosidase